MKPKLRWLSLILPLALFAWAYQAASWRPKLVGVQPFQAQIAGLRAVSFGDNWNGPRLLVSPDGQYLSSCGDFQNSYLTMWSVTSRKRLWQQQSPAQQSQWPLAFSPDSRSLAICSNKGTSRAPYFVITLVETATGKQRGPRMLPFNYTQNLPSTAFLSNHELVVTSSQFATVADAQTGKAIRQWNFKLPAFSVRGQQSPNQSHISADGTTVIALTTGMNQTAVVIYDARTGKQRGTWTYPRVFRNPRLSPDGTLWAMERTNANLSLLYDSATGKQLGVSFIGDTQTSPWAWSADSQNIVTPRLRNMVIAAARTRRQIAEFYVAPDARALALAPDGRFLYALDDTGKIYRWRAR